MKKEYLLELKKALLALAMAGVLVGSNGIDVLAQETSTETLEDDDKFIDDDNWQPTEGDEGETIPDDVKTEKEIKGIPEVTPTPEVPKEEETPEEPEEVPEVPAVVYVAPEEEVKVTPKTGDASKLPYVLGFAAIADAAYAIASAYDKKVEKETKTK